MHRCLYIHEILQNVFKQFRPTPVYRKGDRSTLYALSLACRAFSPPALDCLWYMFEDLQRFIDGLIDPAFLCTPTELEPPTFLEILQKYAPRVRILVIEYDDVKSMQSLLDPEAPLGTSSDPLFPNVTMLKWRAKDPQLLHYIKHFLTDGLRTLYLYHRWAGSDDQLELLCSVFAGSRRVVSSLKIDFMTAPPSGNKALSRAFSAWDNLSSLRLDNPPRDCVTFILTMPKLASLEIFYWCHSPLRVPDWSSCISSPFPSLRSLNIAACSPQTFGIKLVKLLQKTKLTRLSAHFPPSSTMDAISQFLQAIADYCNEDSLQCIAIKFRIWPALSGDFVPFSCIEPLLRFGKIRAFCLSLAFSAPGIPEDQVIRMALAWPELRRLCIYSEAHQTTDSDSESLADSLTDSALPRTTLLSILPLVKHCTHLRHLDIYLDASDIDAREKLRDYPEVYEGQRNYALRFLRVGYSEISHREFVAGFLSEVFPRLEDIISDENPHDTRSLYHEDWQYVAQVLLPILSKAKERERRYLGVRADGEEDGERKRFRKSRRLHELVEGRDGDWVDRENVELPRGRDFDEDEGEDVYWLKEVRRASINVLW